MPLRTPLLCRPSEKAKLEARNGVDQIDYISYLVNDLQIREVRESHIREFQRHAVKDIYPCAGNYRSASHRVKIQGSTLALPAAAFVPDLVREMVDLVNKGRTSISALERAAYVLWRTNWIHPFPGGDGRTARATCCLILCVDMEMMLPGVPSLPTLIYQNREMYVRALREADSSVAGDASKQPDLQAMTAFLERLVTKQLASAIQELKSPKR